jgi:hypothetical protein
MWAEAVRVQWLLGSSQNLEQLKLTRFSLAEECTERIRNFGDVGISIGKDLTRSEGLAIKLFIEFAVEAQLRSL